MSTPYRRQDYMVQCSKVNRGGGARLNGEVSRDVNIVCHSPFKLSRLYYFNHPSPSPPSECVTPTFVARGGQTRRAERGMGGQYFGRREK
jgi:hypothetical protein